MQIIVLLNRFHNHFFHRFAGFDPAADVDGQLCGNIIDNAHIAFNDFLYRIIYFIRRAHVDQEHYPMRSIDIFQIITDFMRQFLRRHFDGYIECLEDKLFQQPVCNARNAAGRRISAANNDSGCVSCVTILIERLDIQRENDKYQGIDTHIQIHLNQFKNFPSNQVFLREYALQGLIQLVKIISSAQFFRHLAVDQINQADENNCRISIISDSV